MNDELTGPLRTIQMLVGALTAGVVGFGTVSLVLVLLVFEAPLMADSGAEIGLILVGAAAVVWMGSLVGSFVVGQAMEKQARADWAKKPGEGPAELMRQYSSVMIVRAALLEGAGIFGVVAFLMTGSWVGMGIAVLSVGSLAMVFPTRERFDGFASRVMGRR